MNLNEQIIMEKYASAVEQAEELMDLQTFEYMDKVAAAYNFPLEAIAQENPAMFDWLYKIASVDVDDLYGTELEDIPAVYGMQADPQQQQGQVGEDGSLTLTAEEAQTLAALLGI